jgi:hypoxanthine phosphoribosyltransferase
LVILGRVPLSFYRKNRAAYLKQYEQLRTQKKKGYASPAMMALARGGIRFARLVIHAYDEERVTASSVSELLGIRMKHLDTFREAVERRHSKEYSE